jgi:hypothetical protein
MAVVRVLCPPGPGGRLPSSQIETSSDARKMCVVIIDELKMAVTEYIRNVDRAILNTVLENTVRRVNKCLETGRGHFEHYL